MSCETKACYLANPLPWCVETIVIPQLTVGAYQAEITDHHENGYIMVGIDENGIIDVSNLADGLFNPFGTYTLKVFNIDDPVLPQQFVFQFECGTFDCIYMTFQDISPIPDSATIS